MLKIKTLIKFLFVFLLTLFVIYSPTIVAAATWSSPAVIHSGGGGRYSSLDFVNGRPAISFNGTGLNYFRANDADGASWPGVATTIVNASAVDTSLEVVNGNPGISYHGSGDKLWYVRANDPNGDTWNGPIIVDNGSNVGYYTSLKVINGNPAISYSNNGDERLWYVRANDPNGDTWGAPIMLDVSTRVLRHTSLEVVNGNPSISYYDANNNSLKYIHATDASGMAWGTPITVDVSGGQHNFLVVANGHPGISYSGGGTQAQMFVRASDPDGDTWGTPVMIDDIENYEESSAAIISGNPAISYYATSSGSLRYSRALDSSGSTWETPMTLDFAPNIGRGQYSSLNQINGHAAISYWANPPQQLRYVREVIPNQTPTVDANGPYLVDEGDSVLVSATGSDPESGPLTYDWDLDNNGSFETPGQSVNFDATSLDPGDYTISVQVTDDGNLTATDSAIVTVNDIPTADDFVLLGKEGVWLKGGVEIGSGDVGANIASTGPFLDSGVEVSVGNNVSILNIQSQVFGDSLRLKNGSQVQDIYYNDLSGPGNVLGSQFSPLSLPLIPSFPVVPSFSAGSTDVAVPANGSQTISAGNYDDLVVSHDATLTFSGGVYNFDSWDLRQDAILYFDAPTEIRIVNKLDAASRVTIMPSPSSSIDASDIKIFVTGINGNSGNLGASPKAAEFGANGEVRANIYVPNGTLFLKDDIIAEGAFLGKWVISGQDNVLIHDSSF